MVAGSIEHGGDHLVVYIVYSSRNRLRQAPATDHGVKLQVKTVLGERVEDEIVAEFPLVNHLAERSKLLHGVPQGEFKFGCFSVVDSYFG